MNTEKYLNSCQQSVYSVFDNNKISNVYFVKFIG